jgi:3-hydroxybutyryl-CoA dehydrogenase
MKYSCEACGREWDYPVETCIFCRAPVSRVDLGNYKVEDIIRVVVPSEDHPITPYYVALLSDSDGSYRFHKTFQHYEIGDVVQIKGGEREDCTLGIIGTGITGRGIAEVALRSGIQVIWKSRNDLSIRSALKILSRNLHKSMSEDEAQLLLQNITSTTDYKCLKDADFVIESVIEDISIKRSIFRILDSVCPPVVVLASNTSSLKISSIAAGLKHPERVVGLHFFNPITRMQLVEIVSAEQTSQDVLERCSMLARVINKFSIIVKDTPGFVVNRLLFAMINEACHMLDEGISSIEEIDKAMKLGANYPMGPFELADLIGLDLCLEIIENLSDAFENQFRPSHVLRNLVKNGYYGRKVGKGFYEY